MFKRITSFVCIALAASLYAAPTANEDYVDQQDAITYTNAVRDANAHADAAAAATLSSANAHADAAASAALSSANAHADAAAGAAISAANAYALEAITAATGGVTTVEADPVFEAARPYLCTIEAARQMTNGIPVVTKATVTGWGFLESFTEADPVFAAWLATDPLANVGRVQSVNGKTGAVSLGASDVGAYPAASGQQLAGSVQVLSAYIGGEDARAVITNYNEGASDIPHFYFEYKTREGTWLRVWDELTRWTRFLTPYELFTNGVNAAIARLDREKAPLAYGFYDTHTGGVAPDGFFSVSSEKIIIAKDMAYQKTITTSGEAWILEANEPMIIDGVTSNGFFKITDGDGNALFEIVKGDKRTVPATCGGVRTETIMGVTHLHITYNVVSDGHPSIAICPDLSDHDWKDETDSSCCANVSWSGSSGAWVAEVWGKSPLPKIFVKGEYQVGGDTYIKNTAPVGFEKVVIGGITYRVTVETVSGKKLMVLTEAL